MFNRLPSGVAYNPRSNVMYVPLSNLCIESTASDCSATPQLVYNTTNIGKFAAGKDKVGRIDAISVSFDGYHPPAGRGRGGRGGRGGAAPQQ